MSLKSLEHLNLSPMEEEDYILHCKEVYLESINKKEFNEIEFAGPSIENRDIEIVLDALREDGWYGERKYFYVEEFEKKFKEYTGRKYAVATINCTSALYISLLSKNIGIGDEVIVPELEWAPGAFVVSKVGATPIFCDVNENDWCINIQSLKKNITSKTKAILVVNLYGNMANWQELEKIAKENNLILIEDMAESLGSKYFGKISGGFGNISCCSFHRTKSINGGGEFGILLTDDEEIYNKSIMLRDLGRGPKTRSYEPDIVALKMIPSNLSASLAYAQFLRLNEIIGKKRHIMNFYKEGLKDFNDLVFNQDDKNIFNGAWTTGLLLGKSYNKSTEQVLQKLIDLGMNAARKFFRPLSSIPAYNNTWYYKDKNPIAYDISDRAINLPCALNLKDEQIYFIIDCIKKALNI